MAGAARTAQNPPQAKSLTVTPERLIRQLQKGHDMPDQTSGLNMTGRVERLTAAQREAREERRHHLVLAIVVAVLLVATVWLAKVALTPKVLPVASLEDIGARAPK
jgi:hypothetical protein